MSKDKGILSKHNLRWCQSQTCQNVHSQQAILRNKTWRLLHSQRMPFFYMLYQHIYTSRRSECFWFHFHNRLPVITMAVLKPRFFQHRRWSIRLWPPVISAGSKKTNLRKNLQSQSLPKSNSQHRKSFHKTPGRPLGPLSRVGRFGLCTLWPRSTWFTLWALVQKEMSREWGTKKRRVMPSVCFAQLAKFGKQKNGQTGNNQEIIEVGRSKVTKASDSIAFWDPFTSLAALQALKANRAQLNYLQTECTLLTASLRKRLAKHQQMHQAFFCDQQWRYTCSALLYPSLALLISVGIDDFTMCILSVLHSRCGKPMLLHYFFSMPLASLASHQSKSLAARHFF